MAPGSNSRSKSRPKGVSGPAIIEQQPGREAQPHSASAKCFAVRSHGDQRYGAYPYVHHLEAVAALVRPYGETAVVIGYLHDVVEDTPVTLTELEAVFGSSVARWVGLLSDEPGNNRKQRKDLTHQKLSRVQPADQLVLVVKAADRLANLRACVSDQRQDKLRMYRREQAAFRAAVYRPGLCDELWVEIDAIIASGSDGDRYPGLPVRDAP